MRNQSNKIGNSNFAINRKEGHENNQRNDNGMSYASVFKKWNANFFKKYVGVRNDGQRQYQGNADSCPEQFRGSGT
jgi:hypothetical protein